MSSQTSMPATSNIYSGMTQGDNAVITNDSRPRLADGTFLGKSLALKNGSIELPVDGKTHIRVDVTPTDDVKELTVTLASNGFIDLVIQPGDYSVVVTDADGLERYSIHKPKRRTVSAVPLTAGSYKIVESDNV